MPILSRRVRAGLCCLLVASCGQSDPEQTVQERFFAMGTWVDVTVGGVDSAAAEAALRDVEAELEVFERDYYPWADGELAELNAAIAAGRGATVSAELARLLSLARELSLASDGLFEPGLGRLVELWGFHSTTTTTHVPPSASAIETALEASGGIATLRIDANHVTSAYPGLELDLGGIAKGEAVARILALLASHGISSALVNAGGDLAVMGRPLGGRPWRVGIRHPREDGLLGVLELTDGEAAFTSGDYERYYERGGQRLHHLLDPETGRPVAHTQALTVVAGDPVRADAAATALFVAGPERWREIARRLGIDAVLRVDASGAVEVTDAMAGRFRPSATTNDILMTSTRRSMQ
jgi:thiamine biosynthesis lipoprotein